MFVVTTQSQGLESLPRSTSAATAVACRKSDRSVRRAAAAGEKKPCPRLGGKKRASGESRRTKKRCFGCRWRGCGKKFFTAYRLQVHGYTHTGEKLFVCLHRGCEKRFAQKADMQRHMLTHSGEKAFACPYTDCGKSFLFKHVLEAHLRIHTGEKPFICPAAGCTRAFSQKGNMRIHLCTHTGERPWPCLFEGCDKRFTTSAQRNRHFRNHGEKQAWHLFSDTTTGRLARCHHDHTYAVDSGGPSPRSAAVPESVAHQRHARRPSSLQQPDEVESTASDRRPAPMSALALASPFGESPSGLEPPLTLDDPEIFNAWPPWPPVLDDAGALWSWQDEDASEQNALLSPLTDDDGSFWQQLMHPVEDAPCP